MKVKPILFNTDMVRAILYDRKTATRQVIKAEKLKCLDSPYHREHPEVPDTQIIGKLIEPPYQPGDILYVRETWAKGGYRSDGKDWKYYYRADKNNPPLIRWHPSIHMPKEAARIWLKVTGVRWKRLQDIDAYEAYSIGIDTGKNNPALFLPGKGLKKYWNEKQIKELKKIWDSNIPKKDFPLYGWEANPYVWAIEFERTVKPDEN